MNTKLSLIIFVSVLIVIMICLIIKDSKETFFYQVKRFFDNCESIDGRLATGSFCKNQLKCGHNGVDGEGGQCENVCRFDPILCDLEDLGSSGKDYTAMCKINDKKNKYSNDYCINKTKSECGVDKGSSDSCPGVNGSTTVCKWDEADKGCKVDKCSNYYGEKENCMNKQYCFYVEEERICKSITGRDGEKGPDLYDGEENGVNAYNKCYNECEKWRDSNPSYYYSKCSLVDCAERCRIYADKKGIGEPQNYLPYPANVVSTGDYEAIKKKVIDLLDNDNGGDDIFGEYIKNNYINLRDRNNNTTQLGEILKEINSVKSIGNDFIQQIDQIGQFQNKYSDYFNEILKNKKSDDPVNRKLERLNMRLKEVKNAFGENGTIDNLQKNIKNMPDYSEPYRQIISIDGQKINVKPVLFKSKDKNNNPIYNSYKNKGPYLISTTNKPADVPVQIPSYLYYGKTNRNVAKVDDTNIVFNSDSSSYNWDLFYREKNNKSDNTSSDIQAPLEILDIDSDYSGLYNDSKNFYFFIVKITSREEYDFYLLQNSSDKLLKNVPKFPFYIIESISRPGYLLNVSKSQNGSDEILLSIKQAEGDASEKFSVDVISTDC